MLNCLPSILKLRRPSDWTHQLILNKQTNKQTNKEGNYQKHSQKRLFVQFRRWRELLNISRIKATRIEKLRAEAECRIESMLIAHTSDKIR